MSFTLENWNIVIEEISQRLEDLKKAVQSCPPYAHAITEIIINNYVQFLEKKNAATYDELIYQRELIQRLLADDLTTEDSIKKVLFYFNYNDDRFIGCLYEILEAQTEPVETSKEKIAVLRLEQKKINQLATRVNCIFSPAMPPLKYQVNNWIEEEIKFLLTGSAPVRHEKEMYVHVPFRGAEIYLLIKSFIDSGGSPGETYKSLFEKTGSHLSNKNQKGFSTESLQKCSDKVDYESKETVKRFLQKMIRNIDSY